VEGDEDADADADGNEQDFWGISGFLWWRVLCSISI